MNLNNVLIKDNGEIVEILPKDESKGFTLEECYALLECDMIQTLDVDGEKIMILDEEAKVTDRGLYNKPATDLIRHRLGDGDYIQGHAMVVEERFFK